MFGKYIKKVNYAIREALELNGKEKVETFHSYFCATEYGSKDGRLHFHVVHFVRALPLGSKDPNDGRSIPYYRLISSFKRFWYYGFSEPIAWRVSGEDNYAKLGWRWPTDKEGVPIDSSVIGQLGAYVAEYVNKAYGKDTEIWKTRMSRNFGTKIIRNAVSLMDEETMMYASEIRARKELIIKGLRIPREILRKEATKRLLQRLRSRRESWSALMQLKSLANTEPQKSIVELYRDMTRRKTNPNSQRCTNTEMLILKDGVVSRMKSCFYTALLECDYEDTRQGVSGLTKERT